MEKRLCCEKGEKIQKNLSKQVPIVCCKENSLLVRVPFHLLFVEEALGSVFLDFKIRA